MAKRKPQLINVDRKSPAASYYGELVIQPPVVEDTGIFQTTYHPVTASDGKVLYRTSNAPDEYQKITKALLSSTSLNEFLGLILKEVIAAGFPASGQRDYFEAIIGREHIEQNVQSGEIGKAIAAAIIFGKALQRLGVRPYEPAVKATKKHAVKSANGTAKLRSKTDGSAERTVKVFRKHHIGKVSKNAAMIRTGKELGISLSTVIRHLARQ